MGFQFFAIRHKLIDRG